MHYLKTTDMERNIRAYTDISKLKQHAVITANSEYGSECDVLIYVVRYTVCHAERVVGECYTVSQRSHLMWRPLSIHKNFLY